MQPVEVKCRTEGPKVQVIYPKVWSREVCRKEEGSLGGVLYQCDYSKLGKYGQEEAKIQDKGTTWVFVSLTALR